MLMTDLDGLITDDDVAWYEEHGWWISPKVIDTRLIENALAGVEDLHNGRRDRELPIDVEQHLAWKPGSSYAMRMHNYAALLNSAVYRLAIQPVIGIMAARLAGTGAVRLFNTTVVDKPPGVDGAKNTVGWHADKAYWATCSSSRMLTAWIPLVPLTEQMGPITMIDRSSAWSGDTADGLRRIRGFVTDDPAALEGRLDAAFAAAKVPMALEIGQVSFHHCLTFHGSPPNQGPRNRVSLTVHLQDDENSWREVRQADGTLASYRHDAWCRRDAAGNPDYGDPDICPQIWPVPGPAEGPNDVR
jgi:ectoine hydroxylase-related dioxygenase (phytanoyl-CoA dioxygenase family)